MAGVLWAWRRAAQSVYVGGAIGAEIVPHVVHEERRVHLRRRQRGSVRGRHPPRHVHLGAVRRGARILPARVKSRPTPAGRSTCLRRFIVDLYPGVLSASGLLPDARASRPSSRRPSRVRAATTSALVFARQPLGTPGRARVSRRRRLLTRGARDRSTAFGAPDPAARTCRFFRASYSTPHHPIRGGAGRWRRDAGRHDRTRAARRRPAHAHGRSVGRGRLDDPAERRPRLEVLRAFSRLSL